MAKNPNIHILAWLINPGESKHCMVRISISTATRPYISVWLQMDDEKPQMLQENSQHLRPFTSIWGMWRGYIIFCAHNIIKIPILSCHQLGSYLKQGEILPRTENKLSEGLKANFTLKRFSWVFHIKHCMSSSNPIFLSQLEVHFWHNSCF